MHRSPQRWSRWTLPLVALFALVWLPSLRAQRGSDVAVVVHPGVGVENLTLGELRRVMLGDRGFWPANVRVTLLIRAPVAHERDVILKTVCAMTEAQFRQHWIAKVFRADTVVAPKIVYSTDMAMDLVTRTPGAITVVDPSQVPRTLKVVKIDGRAPGEAGYALR